MKKRGQSKEALIWLDNQIKKFPANKMIRWTKEIVENNKSELTNTNDATTRILVQLMEVKEIQQESGH